MTKSPGPSSSGTFLRLGEMNPFKARTGLGQTPECPVSCFADWVWAYVQTIWCVVMSML